MNTHLSRLAILALSSALLATVPEAQSAAVPHSPAIIHLRADSLTQPLGIDTPAPMLSWQIQDPSAGAEQTAYRVMVYASDPTLTAAEAAWDSGRVASSTSNGIPYGGPRLQPSTRYFWRVQVWNRQGKLYPTSKRSWWETGLLEQSAWQGKWIGYESQELHSLRTSGAKWITNQEGQIRGGQNSEHDFRLLFKLDQPVRSAVLFTTGQDTAAAWVNGTQVMTTKALNAWKQMPWQTYERQDVTSLLRAGQNLLAIAITHYAIPREPVQTSLAPMSACLYVVFADGTRHVFVSSPREWKASLNAGDQWWGVRFDDSNWRPAIEYISSTNNFGSTDTGRPWPTGPVVLLRRAFNSGPKVVSARLYATALGAYKFSLNGQPVGDQILAPGWMDFREHVPYQVYDVTSQIAEGANAIGAYLAPGWYTTPLKWFRQGNNYGDTEPALRAQLRLQHADGSVTWVSTDQNWKAEPSEVLQAEIYDGETLDARKQLPGWNRTGFNDAAWHPVSLVSPIEPRIIAQYFPPIRQDRSMTFRSITRPAPGVYILDFGQNMSAIPRLRVRGASGDDIKLRFAEVLNPDGTLYVENLRTAKATDHYIMSGVPDPSGFETFQPEFTFHGFRYMEVTGLRRAPTPSTLTAIVLHTDAPFSTRLATGNPMVNQLWSNVLWGQRSNFVGVPTDCPQRDERLGWSADAQVFWRTAAYNMDLATFSEKYASDLAGTQVNTAMYGIFAPGTDQPNPGYGAAWSDAGVIVPWTGWIQSGNRRIVDENWSAMQHYLSQIQRENPDYLWRNGLGAAFGDWLTPTITTPEDLLATAYWAYDVSLMQQMALATGRAGDAATYDALHQKIKSAFQKAYVRADGTVGSIDRYPSIPPPSIHPEPGESDQNRFVETQTGYVLALHMDLLPTELRTAAAKRLVQKIEANHWLLGTGFLGTPYLLEVLSDTGHSDVAYRLLLNQEYPSWGYIIAHGATTTWERWNGDQMRSDPSMNSYNHYAYGAVAEWMYRYAAGIDTSANDSGFHTINLHPNFDARLRQLSMDYDSAYGPIHSDWTAVSDTITWHIVIPPNTGAVIEEVRTNATFNYLNGTRLPNDSSRGALLRLKPGSYTLTARLRNTSPS